jgi:hypothetical protein
LASCGHNTRIKINDSTALKPGREAAASFAPRLRALPIELVLQA